jgi:DNA-binding NtrC family response regulator
MNVILVGTDAALLEGLAQSFATSGLTPHVVGTLYEACEVAADAAPIMVVIDRHIAATSGGDALAIQLAPGGSLVLYRGSAEQEVLATPAILQRAVMAELTLPLERNRLVALATHVRERAVETGRTPAPSPESDVRRDARSS